MPDRNIRVTVSRFDISIDEAPYYQTYEVPLDDDLSVLNVLDYIYTKLDSSLAYYSHAVCQHGMCGSCTLIVNGKQALICQTLVEGDITVEPLPGFIIVRDLVIERKEQTY